MANTKNSAAAAAQAVPVSSFWALSPVEHDGVRYQVGDPVRMGAEEAAPLLALGVLSEVQPAEDGAEP